MAEAFSNALSRAAGIVTTSSSGSIGITTNKITGISTVSVTVGDLIDTPNFIQGSSVASYGTASGEVTIDRDSTNTGATSNQTVAFLGVTTTYTSSAKSILIGGTFANNTTSQVNLTVSVYDQSTGTQTALASDIPVPTGSSFVIADTGKTVLEGLDEVRLYTDVDNAIDANLSILTGVS